MARALTPAQLRDAKAIAEQVMAKGEIYRGEELLAEAVLFLLEKRESLSLEIEEMRERE